MKMINGGQLDKPTNLEKPDLLGIYFSHPKKVEILFQRPKKKAKNLVMFRPL